jgi:hypothetical protein
MNGLRGDDVVLAGGEGVRVLGSIWEAERELAGGFRPEVVLVGQRLRGRPARWLASAVRARAGQGIPVLAVSGDGGRVRITLESEAGPADPEELWSLLRVLDDLCDAPLLQAG